ncbi:hypothetical protein ALQ18_01763 [Pseudomonas marginalis pv. marginalis]|nr:hypothetical protein ALQ18_01763 [Pseudomonas marginalis pv. marginalis]
MPLFLPEHWVWDFWFIQHEDHTHRFHLSAPRSLNDPNLRHWNVRISHARFELAKLGNPAGCTLAGSHAEQGRLHHMVGLCGSR